MVGNVNLKIVVEFFESGGNYFIVIENEKYKSPYSEYAILKKLLNEKNHYFTIEDLMLIGWPDRVVSVNSVPVAITNLRKIFKHHTAQKVILNTQNLGYIIGADSDVQIANSSLLTDVAVKEKIRLPINRVNQALDISLKFPLLIINIVFLAYILIAKTSLNTKKDQIYDISQTQSAVIISPKGTHVKNLFDSITSTSTLNIDELSKYLTDVSTSEKSILFVSKYRQKIIIDCIRGNQLDSLYGDHVDKILSELKAIGCKL